VARAGMGAMGSRCCPVLLYLPGELYSLLRHPRPFKWGVVAANAVIVLYMLILRVKAQRRPVRAI